MKDFLRVVRTWESIFGERREISTIDIIGLRSFLNPCPSEELIDAICAMYLKFAGMSEIEYDANQFSFWTISRSIAYPRVASPDQHFFCFADYLFESAIYAIVLNGCDMGQIKLVLNGKTKEVVAEDLDDFFRLYLTDLMNLAIA
jgi:hypothetical protein